MLQCNKCYKKIVDIKWLCAARDMSPTMRRLEFKALLTENVQIGLFIREVCKVLTVL